MTRREQLDSFYQYASAQIEREQNEDDISIDDLFAEWRESLNGEELTDLLNRRPVRNLSAGNR